MEKQILNKLNLCELVENKGNLKDAVISYIRLSKKYLKLYSKYLAEKRLKDLLENEITEIEDKVENDEWDDIISDNDEFYDYSETLEKVYMEEYTYSYVGVCELVEAIERRTDEFTASEIAGAFDSKLEGCGCEELGDYGVFKLYDRISEYEDFDEDEYDNSYQNEYIY